MYNRRHTWFNPNSTKYSLGCIFLFQEYPFLGPCFSFLPGFLRIPLDSFFFRRNFFTGTSFGLWDIPPTYSGITDSSGILFPPTQNYRDFDWETMALERRQPLTWAVVDGRPQPSISPWPWHDGQRSNVLGQTCPSTTAWAISLFWGLDFVCMILIE